MTKQIKPIVSEIRFCFECGKKLRGKYAYQMEWEGHLRIFHKSCAEYLLDVCESERLGMENAR